MDPRPSLTWHTKRSESDRIWPPISAHFGTETVVRQPEGIATIAGTNESHNILKKAIGALNLGVREIVLPRIENGRPELDEILGLAAVNAGLEHAPHIQVEYVEVGRACGLPLPPDLELGRLLLQVEFVPRLHMGTEAPARGRVRAGAVTGFVSDAIAMQLTKPNVTAPASRMED